MKWILRLSLWAFFGLCGLHASAQGPQQFQLGVQYYQQGDFVKAVEIFEGLHKQEPLVNTYYVYLYNAYVQLKAYEELEKLARNQARREPQIAAYRVDEGYAFKLQGNLKKSNAIYTRLIKELEPSRGAILGLANAFRTRNEQDMAVNTLLEGRKLLGAPYDFPLDLADLYASQGKKRDMSQAYLDYLVVQPQQLAYVQNMLQSRLAEEDYEDLKNLLLETLRVRPDDMALSELMIWFFVQQRDFSNAFLQARALDRRNRENGLRIMELAASAIENEKFEAAAAMYRYVIDKKEDNAFYLEARYKLLTTDQARLERTPAATGTEWQQLAEQYKAYITEFPLFPNLPQVKQSLAAVWAFQLQETDSAMELLEATLDLRRGDQRVLAGVKLDLGDLYLIAGELWDASLMYAQVEKDYANEPLGQEAKFRNARLSFYKGEFEWSQAQLDVLKASTTQRISNDAIALSLLITENYDLDTTVYPMEMFARADLKAFCRQYATALAGYDSLLQQFPGHALTDEVLFRKGQIYEKLGNTPDALLLYEAVLAQHGQDLYGDDALFALARLTEDRLADKDRAMELFQRLLTDYPDSHYVSEARRRFRSLRGDTLN